MAGPPLDRRKDARYHVVASTQRWAEFVAALAAAAKRSADERDRRAAERKRETTYAKDELGGH